MREAGVQPMFWPRWAKRSKLEMNFHFFLTLPLRARGYCGWQGWSEKGWHCPTGELYSHEEKNAFTLGGSWTRSLP